MKTENLARRNWSIVLVFYMWTVQEKQIWFFFFALWFFFSKHLLGQWIGWPPTHQLASLHCPQREENFSQQDGSHWNHVSDKHYKFQHVPNTSNHKTSLPQSTTHKSLVVLRVVFCQFLDKNDYEEQSLQLFTLLCG